MPGCRHQETKGSIIPAAEIYHTRLTGVGVPLHGVAALRGDAVDGQDLVVPRRRDHRVDVHLVDDVLRLVPPPCISSKLRDSVK
jgi:hypothetical protein